jgi:hypothetical protein
MEKLSKQKRPMLLARALCLTGSPTTLKLVTGKCLFSSKGDLWKMYELLVTPTNLQFDVSLKIADYG